MLTTFEMTKYSSFFCYPDTYLLHSVHCHRQTVQKATCSWGHMPTHEPALQCCGQSAECSHSSRSEEPKQEALSIFPPLIYDSPVDIFVIYLEFLQLLQYHVIWHVVEEPISGSEDDVTELYVKGSAVCGVRAEEQTRVSFG